MQIFIIYHPQLKSIRENLQDLEIKNGLWDDRVTWRARIHLAKPDNFGNEL